MIQIKFFHTEAEANLWLGQKSYVKNIVIKDIKLSEQDIMVIYEILPIDKGKYVKMKSNLSDYDKDLLERIKRGEGLPPLEDN